MKLKSFGLEKGNKAIATLLGFIGNLFFAYCVIIALALIMFSSVTLECSVIGSSMKPTYNNDEKKGNDVVFVNIKDHDYAFGDVVVIDIEGRTDPIIKRVVGMSGDIIDVVLSEGEYLLEVNGKLIEEPYLNVVYNESELKYSGDITGMQKCKENFEHLKLAHPELVTSEGKIKVGEGEIFALGDNRHNSQDSTYYGTFETSQIKGIVERELLAGESKFLFYWNYIVNGEFLETLRKCF